MVSNWPPPALLDPPALAMQRNGGVDDRDVQMRRDEMLARQMQVPRIMFCVLHFAILRDMYCA